MGKEEEGRLGERIEIKIKIKEGSVSALSADGA